MGGVEGIPKFVILRVGYLSKEAAFLGPGMMS
jgi:hypothetical protein